MNERVTLISLINQESVDKIQGLVSKINYALCKVPFGKNVDNRVKADTLPYHFTLYSWNIEKKNEARVHLWYEAKYGKK